MKDPVRDGDPRDLAHDFNNLLTAIIGAADAILERPKIDPETRADVEQIREGARRGALLVRSLRADPHTVPAIPGLISVNETIKATARLLAHRLGAKITLALVLEDSDAQVRVDPFQLDRVLLNLIINARHAMPNGGTVTLATGRRVVAEPRASETIPPGDYVTVSVADTGCGIPSHQVPRIFDEGFTSRRDTGGSGIGLASVRDITRRAGGFLAVESIEGHGARFEIYLPCWVPTVAPVQKPTTDEPVGTVLLVEDDPLVRRVAERVLRRAGWTVLLADSAEEALEVLRQSSCDLMISDVAMPGMDGVALTRLALARQPGLPVILTSGYERPDVMSGIAVGTVDFLTKPYDQADLLAAVARNVREPAAGSAHSA